MTVDRCSYCDKLLGFFSIYTQYGIQVLRVQAAEDMFCGLRRRKKINTPLARRTVIVRSYLILIFPNTQCHRD